MTPQGPAAIEADQIYFLVPGAVYQAILGMLNTLPRAQSNTLCSVFC